MHKINRLIFSALLIANAAQHAMEKRNEDADPLYNYELFKAVQSLKDIIPDQILFKSLEEQIPSYPNITKQGLLLEKDSFDRTPLFLWTPWGKVALMESYLATEENENKIRSQFDSCIKTKFYEGSEDNNKRYEIISVNGLLLPQAKIYKDDLPDYYEAQNHRSIWMQLYEKHQKEKSKKE
ncbi:MAG TPA: hypothetical protein VHO47_01455 [Candidatus Babeliales bacterium]|nr:hypothetical protein [Candidatus Babeliales bacterium]